MSSLGTGEPPVLVDLTEPPPKVGEQDVIVVETPEAGSTEAHRRRTVLGAVLLVGSSTIAALAVWFLLFSVVFSGLQEHGNQTRLYNQFRYQLATETAALGSPIKSGSPVALLNAPSVHWHNLVIVEGTTSRLLTRGPGHLRNTPLPGQAGDSVILGRSVTYGGPFRDIATLRRGASIRVTTGQGTFVYRVLGLRYAGDRFPTALKSNQSRLTLVSSTSHGWRSGWAPTETVYLDADLVHGGVQAVPEGLPVRISTASLPMHIDPSGMIPLILWLAGLITAAFVLALAWRRSSGPQTWAVGVPIIIGLLWGANGALMRFLPNLL